MSRTRKDLPNALRSVAYLKKAHSLRLAMLRNDRGAPLLKKKLNRETRHVKNQKLRVLKANYSEMNAQAFYNKERCLVDKAF